MLKKNGSSKAIEPPPEYSKLKVVNPPYFPSADSRIPIEL